MSNEAEDLLTINKDDFSIVTMDDELRVDGLCRELMKRFYFQLQEKGVSPEQASALAGSADYFVRDFVVSIKGRNLFHETPGLVRQFAGNWYIVNTLEPNRGELQGHLQGIVAFYRFLYSLELISPEYLGVVEQEGEDLEYYAARIDSFWEIRGDGYFAWEQQCSLKDIKPCRTGGNS